MNGMVLKADTYEETKKQIPKKHNTVFDFWN